MEQIIAPAIGARLAVDQIGGVNYPLSKLAFGAEDEATQVSPETPFPTADSAVAAVLAQLLVAFGGTLAVSAASLPLPAGAATAERQDTGNASLTAIANALAGALSVRQPGTTFTDRTVATLTAGQAGGTAMVLNVNANRRVLAITPANDGKLYIASSSGNGFFWPLYAGVTRVLSGPDCPTSAIYVSGQTAGAALPMAEG